MNNVTIFKASVAVSALLLLLRHIGTISCSVGVALIPVIAAATISVLTLAIIGHASLILAHDKGKYISSISKRLKLANSELRAELAKKA